jgi:hypothetical protein
MLDHRGGGPHEQVTSAESEQIMQSALRRIRGAVGMGVLWAAAWSAVGSIPRWLLGMNTDAPLPLVFGVFGFAAGVTFSGLLVLTEGRRSFDQLSARRFAVWGAVGGLLLAAAFAKAAAFALGDVLMIAPTFAVVCAGCASGSLALARRAERRANVLPRQPAPIRSVHE